MSKKNFKNNPAMAFINTQEDPEEQGVQVVHDTQQVQGTQGRKGKKLPRINMAFSVDNLDYLKFISGIEGISQTQYVNNLIAADKEKRKDFIDRLREVIK